MHDMVVLAGQIFIAGVLGVSGWHKFTQPAYYQGVMAAYMAREHSVSVALPRLLGIFELLIALCLLLPYTSWYAGVGGGVLIFTYAALIAIQVVKGNLEMDCGCTGPAAAHTRISPWLLLRNGLLLGFVSLGILYPVMSVSFNNWALSALTGAFLLAVYFAVEQLFANAQAMSLVEEQA